MSNDRHPEEDYIAKLEAEQKAKLREQYATEQAEADRAARKAAHGGKCGKCGGDLSARVFRGIEIDVCQTCGAVLLDNGELEALAGHDNAGLFSGLRDLFGGSRE